MNHIKQPEFNENEFEMLMNIFYFKYFSIINEFNIVLPTRQKEFKVGYDFANRKGVPLFLQYKVSKYCTRNSSAPFLKSRKLKGYNKNNGCFFFNIHSSNQHNILYNYKKNNYYVAPIFYKRNVLNNMFNHLFNNDNLYNNYNIDYYFSNNDKHIRFSNLKYPNLFNTIYIQPHSRITDSTHHKYAYDTDFNVSFHSDEVYELKGKFFFEILDDISTQETISFSNISNNIISLLNEIEYINPNIYYKILIDLFDESIEIKIDTLDYFFKIISEKYEEYWKLVIGSLLLKELLGIEILILE